MTQYLPRVTDHCVVRFLERAKGFDIEAVRTHIATLCAGAVATGARSMQAEGVRFEINNGNTVVTAEPIKQFPSKTRRALVLIRRPNRMPHHAGEGEI